MSWTTELDAVNAMLKAIQEAKVDSLDSELPEVLAARDTLQAESRKVQSRGWHFNREYRYPFTPNADGEIVLGPEVLELDPSNRNNDYIPMGTRLYNKTTRDFKFNKAVECDVIFFRPFDHLPEAVRSYITIRASRVFQRDQLGSQSLDKTTEVAEQEALILALRYETRQSNPNMLNDDERFSRVLRRR